MKRNIITLGFLLLLVACQVATPAVKTTQTIQERERPSSITDIDQKLIEQKLSLAGYTVLLFNANNPQIRLFETVPGQRELIVSVKGNDNKPTYERAFEVLNVLYRLYDVELYTAILQDTSTKKVFKFSENKERFERILNGEIKSDKLHPDLELPYTEE